MTNVTLVRRVGVSGAVMMGLGSIIGTGVFVSLGLAAGLAGQSMILALFIAGCFAICNGLSSAQLAAAHPVSGGTYEYGYQYLNPWLGFLAGWLFVCAKSASAAVAAIGFGAYFLQLFGLTSIESWQIGLVVVAATAMITLFGIQKSNLTNVAIVSVTFVSLITYVFVLGFHLGFDRIQNQIATSLSLPSLQVMPFFEATALLFVAYTGYGRIATLGEEIFHPEKNIPKAIIVTLLVSFALYLGVAIVSLIAVGPDTFWLATVTSAAPLPWISKMMGYPLVGKILAIGAMTAILGVLLNLILGLSRVIFAMARKGDFPSRFTYIHPKYRSPSLSIIGVGCLIAFLVVWKDIQLAWSFSAFTVLVYYALTNAAALRLPQERRLYPRGFAWAGLFGCLLLSVWIEKDALILGGSILGAGIVWRLILQLYQARLAKLS